MSSNKHSNKKRRALNDREFVPRGGFPVLPTSLSLVITALVTASVWLFSRRPQYVYQVQN